MIIWIIGMMFTFGLFLRDDTDEPETWGKAVKIALSLCFLWPALLGVWASGVLDDKKEVLK